MFNYSIPRHVLEFLRHFFLSRFSTFLAAPSYRICLLSSLIVINIIILFNYLILGQVLEFLRIFFFLAFLCSLLLPLTVSASCPPLSTPIALSALSKMSRNKQLSTKEHIWILELKLNDIIINDIIDQAVSWVEKRYSSWSAKIHFYQFYWINRKVSDNICELDSLYKSYIIY